MIIIPSTMKIILFVCLFFIGANSTFAQYHKTRNLSTMITTFGKAETIRTLDSVIQILFTNPIDTIPKSEIWYGTLQPRTPAMLLATPTGGTKLEFASIYLRAYYWMWQISTNNIPITLTYIDEEKAILVGEFDIGIFDCSPIRDSIDQRWRIDDIIFLSDTSRYIIEPIFTKYEWCFSDLKNAYVQWINIVRNEGLAAAQEKNIPLLPKKFKWRLLRSK